ncbi:nitrate/sulfonate/bicarbonate ABC transporter ATP-binding protein [Rhodoferax aquaticus]|uniref:Nitrate/sulfonate/bicarbonate ABC transporter ATP-binding protein n=1 Tax=Rhodoferax aquaticus TaxID=2527691 RepID=A0A515ELD2_9BURK|nr:nitrate/sulfonate/bicarbonate ABC transporter ATP-binding protein [Rhodoferax aquaticus]QDL53480.1 nitrate/sulfonate/bicarbonate ABC transporter ATP-binding protein [Rhodoferax aquaticus]
MKQTIVDLKAVGKSFNSADGAPRTVLDNVDFTLREREIVALLGQSGSGKSTLLRIMAGLVSADRGDVLYRGQPLYGPARGISMVFQSFALFPWLTVQQNVEIGLEAQGVPRAEREKRAEKVIDLIGLSGFEGALPRELSGGMRQRVGIARALVVDPDVLLMDEAFSALDVLTGERLRDDILELWEAQQISTKAILVVSHNIQEAVMMADRVLIFASDPGRVRYEMRVDLPRPRDADSEGVRTLVDEIYAVMTAGRLRSGKASEEVEPMRLDARLPDADIGLMEGLLERLMDDPFTGHADLPQLAEETELTDEELLPVAEALALLEFAELESGDLNVTELGKSYVAAENDARQALFAKQLLKRIPLAAHIHHSLQQEPAGEIKEEHFLAMLRDSLDREEAERVLNVAIEWGRYGEVYSYNYNTGMIQLPEVDDAPTS